MRCDDELFFHSNDASDFDQLEQGDLADFCIHYNDRSGKYAADSVVKVVFVDYFESFILTHILVARI